MKTVQLTVEDNRLETLLTIIKNLKKDIVKEINIIDIDSFSIPVVSDEENQYYKNMSNDDKIIALEKSFKFICKGVSNEY